MGIGRDLRGGTSDISYQSNYQIIISSKHFGIYAGLCVRKVLRISEHNCSMLRMHARVVPTAELVATRSSCANTDDDGWQVFGNLTSHLASNTRADRQNTRHGLAQPADEKQKLDTG